MQNKLEYTDFSSQKVQYILHWEDAYFGPRSLLCYTREEIDSALLKVVGSNIWIEKIEKLATK